MGKKTKEGIPSKYPFRDCKTKRSISSEQTNLSVNWALRIQFWRSWRQAPNLGKIQVLESNSQHLFEVTYTGEYGLPGDTQMFQMRVFDLSRVCLMQVRAVPAKSLTVPASKKTHVHMYTYTHTSFQSQISISKVFYINQSIQPPKLGNTLINSCLLSSTMRGRSIFPAAGGFLHRADLLQESVFCMTYVPTENIIHFHVLAEAIIPFNFTKSADHLVFKHSAKPTGTFLALFIKILGWSSKVSLQPQVFSLILAMCLDRFFPFQQNQPAKHVQKIHPQLHTSQAYRNNPLHMLNHSSQRFITQSNQN